MKLKQFSKKSVSLLLALMMLISAVSIGTFTTTAADVAPAESNADVDIMPAAASDTFTKNSDFYIDITSTWQDLISDGKVFVRFSYGDDESNYFTYTISRTELTAANNVSGTIYKVKVPDNDYVRAVMVERVNPSNNNVTGFNDGNLYNYFKGSASSRSSDGQNLIKFTGWGSGKVSTYEWDTYSGSSSGGSAKYYLIGDFDNWNANNTNHPINTSDGENHFYYDQYLTNGEYFKLTDGSTLYGPSSNADMQVGTSGVRVVANGDGAFKFTGPSGTYRIKIDSQEPPYVWIENVPGGSGSSNWYLTGYINGGDHDTPSEGALNFTQDKSNPNIFTLTTTFQTDNQYVLMYDGSQWYHPVSDNALSGTATGNINDRPRDNPKWFVSDVNGVTVTFTWNSSTKTLSWDFGTGDPDTYLVDIVNGITVDNNVLGQGSFSRNDTSDKSVTKNRNTDSYRTRFYTKISKTFDNGGTTAYQYQVYGYSILITKTDGTQEVASVSAAAGTVSELESGLFSATYTFPEDISYARITPIYVTSDEYNEANNMTLTTIYLRYTPGDKEFFGGTYEPSYYTWRAREGDAIQEFVTRGGSKKSLYREPTGGYPGQKMLYVGNGTYMAIVEDYNQGVLFNNGGDGKRQTYDYDEFGKLQKLGYNNITFEPNKNNGHTITDAIIGSKASNGNYIYGSSSTQTISSGNLTSEFQLYKNLSGDYIDVFGNPLQRTTTYNGSKNINEDDADVKSLTGSALLNKILDLVGKTSTQVLYGARKGYSDGTYQTNSTYGMNYPVRVYYFTNSGSNANMVSQIISGYGTIEYNYYKKGTTITNAARYTGTNGTANAAADGVIGIDWGYYLGSATTATNFTSTYTIIPNTYAGSPYLVSYAEQTDKDDYYRIDGRWYYTKDITQFNVTVKVGTMSGRNFIENDEVGTARINNHEVKSLKVEQGTMALISAAAKSGYKFVGFYDTNGNRIDVDGANYNLLVVADTEIHAVFEPLPKGTLSVRNDIFRDKKEYSIGDGITGVEIIVYDESGSEKDRYGGRTSVEAVTTKPLESTDRYQIILYGKAEGDDTFVRFLAAALSIYGGETDYTVLDETLEGDIGLREQKNTGDNSTWIYTFDIVNWSALTAAFGTDSISLQYYTDISRASNLATLTYQYLDRFDQVQTYVVTGVKLTDAEINGTLDPNDAFLGSDGKPLKYCPSKKKVLDNAPEIDDLYKDCLWQCTGADENLDLGTAEVYLIAVQTAKPINTWIKYYDAVEGWKYEPLKGEVTQTNPDGYLYYNDLVYISTSATDENGKAFSFWKQFDVNEKGEPVNRANPSQKLTDADLMSNEYGEIFTTFNTIGIRMTVDKLYVACYDIEDTTGTDFNIEMREAVYTREKYTNDETGQIFDYIYADFALQFTAFRQDGDLFGKQTFKDLVNQANSGGNEGNGRFRNIEFGVLTIATDYEFDGNNPQVDTTIKDEAIKEMIDKNSIFANSNKKSGDFVTDVYLSNTNGNYVYMNRNLNDIVDDLTILGRYDYYLKFENSAYYQSIVFTVYSYIRYDEFENDVWTTKYELSRPRALSIYAAGNQGAYTE